MMALLSCFCIRRRSSVLVAIAVVLLDCGGVYGQGAAATAAGSFRIAGRIVNATTGEPVRRATVAALSEEDRQMVASGQSDGDGRFSLENLPAGKYPLTASKRGFRTAFYDEHDDFNSAIVTGPDQDTTQLVFRLVPGAVIHGVVSGDGGDPAENASVLLFKRQPNTLDGSDPGEIREIDGTTTDDTGAYEFSNLAGGEYFVAVSTSPWYAMHPGGGSSRRRPESEPSPLDVAYPVTFFDSTTDEASANPINVGAGSRVQADINLHAVPALRIQVSSPRRANGEGVARPELRQMIFGAQISAESTGFVDALQTGVADFSGIAPGHYQLVQGDPPRIVDLNAASSQEVDPAAGTPAVSITGTVRTAEGAAVPESMQMLLEPVGGGSRAAMQATARKGEFKFDTVAPGPWTLTALNQTGLLPVVSIVSGGAAVAGNQISVRDRPLAVAATVSSSLSRVQGFARKENKGVPGVMIVLVPRQPSAYRALVRRDQSDSDGSFGLRDVPAGQYMVIAIEDGWNLDWSRRENIQRYLTAGIPVTVSGPSGPAGSIVRLPAAVPVQAR